MKTIFKTVLNEQKTNNICRKLTFVQNKKKIDKHSKEYVKGYQKNYFTYLVKTGRNQVLGLSPNTS